MFLDHFDANITIKNWHGNVNMTCEHII